MYEIILQLGIFTVLLITFVSFLIVYFLAETGKEVSFWGVKFYKKFRPARKIGTFRPILGKFPNDWKAILEIFRKSDSPIIHEKELFEKVKLSNSFTELKVRQICIDMEKFALLEYSFNYYRLQERALKYVNNVESL
jgi:hypothetical protein